MRGNRFFACAAMIAVAFLALAPRPGHAETRALLAGVWHFDSPIIPDLKGPENDLAAMEAFVRSEGATDVTVLRNEQVTRTSIETQLHALGLRAKPGDWILFYYSGHGAEAEAAVKGTADGDLDQFIPLARFDPDAQDAERFIVDKDFYAWLSRYFAPDVQILMIADTCHSGTLNRSVDPRAFQFTPRLAFRGDTAEFKLIPRPAPRFPSILANAGVAVGARGNQPVDRPDLANLVFIAAAQDDQLALEAPMPVSGAPSRGILTYSLEQGLTSPGPDGKTLAADLNHDGHITVSEIGAYLDSAVRALTGQRQEPRTYYPSSKSDLTLFATPAPPRPVAPPALPGVFAIGARPDALAAAQDSPWRVSPAQGDADFVWDTTSGAVLRRSGDTVAQGVTSLAGLTGVVEKWNAVAALQSLLDEGPARLAVGPEANGARYAPGAHVRLSLKVAPQATAAGPLYATVFNIASDGTVQLLYPVSAEDGDGRVGGGDTLPLIENTVVPPYGADHVVALLLPEKPAAFRALLRNVDGQRLALRLVAPIRDLLARGGGRAGLSIGELYTGK